MLESGTDAVEGVVSQIPCGLFVLTSAYDRYRSGLLAQWVQRCSIDPPMIMVAIPKGQPVEPLILESRAFALCRIRADDRLLLHKFATRPERGDDPFVALSSIKAPSGSPILDRSLSYLDCQVVRHIELESDHRVYVGQIQAAALLNDAPPGYNGEREPGKRLSD